MNNDILVSVVAPVFNEEDCIKKYIDETIKVLKLNYLNYELLLIDDGSIDNTTKIVEEILLNEKNIRLISLSRNYGREIAMTAGLDSCIGDYIVMMDSDLQDSPNLIPSLINKAIEEKYDIVYAARTSRDGESFLKKISSKLFYRITTKLTGLKIPDNAGDFRVFNRKAVNSLIQLKESNRYMKMLYAYVGFSVGSIPFNREKRFAGTTKYNYFKLINASLDAIISFSSMPLRIVSLLSVFISFLLFLTAGGVFIYKLLDSTNSIASGWASTIVLITFLFSILFIFLAVISEYISRILVESKNRPLYYIKKESNSSVLKDKNIVDDL
ncbi:glycosyltransferase family 2 protein [Aliarcobacter butzleri]|uniref:glycosyltransferase family 2 protein n=1 Tax=Aliarcobacter butzleri TaxID=28197 RepID=UPI0012F800D0|nr:glycosyltransferase family 2 protein [Aliarcobacter butzleri]